MKHNLYKNPCFKDSMFFLKSYGESGESACFNDMVHADKACYECWVNKGV